MQDQFSDGQEQFRRLESIFHGALQIAAGPARDAYLERECAHDSALRAEVAALLEAHEHEVAWEEQSRAERPAASPLPAFGIFQAEKSIGRGGMGVVYLARRTDGEFDQLVAVKTLLPEAVTGVLRDAFLRERSILASLRHPAIAQVLDGGVRPDGTPYLVMEYVEGQRVDAYCAQKRLGLAARIALFLSVCDAVAFAHRHLVVHLDLKPSNILVTADGHPKLLDFGTAKILDAADSSVTQGLATPRYASPEQLRGERASVASDIYSLAVVLAELVTGHWPFGDPTSRMQALRRAVQDVAPRPLDSLPDSAHAESCGMTLHQLRREVGGDLGVVLLKALESDPERRYRTVDEFARDLRNFSEGLPVLARPQTRGYRAARFLARNRKAVAFAAVAAVIVFSLGGYALLAQRRALEQGRRAQQVNAFLMRLLQSTNPRFGGRRDETVFQLVELALAQADTMLAEQPKVKADLGLMAGGDQIFSHGLAAADATFAGAVDAARRSGDPGALIATLSMRAANQVNTAGCTPANAALMRESTAIATREGERIKNEYRLTQMINHAIFAASCTSREEAAGLAHKALALARSIPENSPDVFTPPVALHTYALIAEEELQGCAAGRPTRRETAAYLAAHPGYDYLESVLHRQQAQCAIVDGKFDEGAAEFARAFHLASGVLGDSFVESRWLRAQYALALAYAGKPEAVTEARAVLNSGDCSASPTYCWGINSFASQALVAMRQPDQLQPHLDYIAANPALRPVADTCRFVIQVDRGDFRGAEPYRAAALKSKDRIPAGSVWRTRIESALAASGK